MTRPCADPECQHALGHHMLTPAGTLVCIIVGCLCINFDDGVPQGADFDAVTL